MTEDKMKIVFTGLVGSAAGEAAGLLAKALNEEVGQTFSSVPGIDGMRYYGMEDISHMTEIGATLWGEKIRSGEETFWGLTRYEWDNHRIFSLPVRAVLGMGALPEGVMFVLCDDTSRQREAGAQADEFLRRSGIGWGAEADWELKRSGEYTQKVLSAPHLYFHNEPAARVAEVTRLWVAHPEDRRRIEEAFR